MVISPNNTSTPAYYRVSGLENTNINSDQLRSLLYLYAPIIGSVGVFLYQLLWEEGLVNRQLKKIYQVSIKSLLSTLNTSWAKFHLIRMQLEAMNLLKTILDRDKNLYSWYILPPLTSTFFLMKNNFFRLLEQNLSYEQKKIRMRLFGEKLFQQQKKWSIEHNISASFNKIFNKNSSSQKTIVDHFHPVDQQLFQRNLKPNSYYPFRQRIFKMIRFFNLDTTFLINLIVTSYQADHFRFDLFEKSLSRLLDQQAL